MKGYRFASILVVLTIAFGLVPPSPVRAVDSDTVSLAMAERDQFGLPADFESVRGLMISDKDVGTISWGIPLTKVEMDAVDIRGRGNFANAASDALLPFARSIPTFAGAYFDQRSNGSLVVLLTERNAEVEAQIRSFAPPGSRTVAFQSAAHSETELVEAMTSIWRVFESEFPGVELLNASVDVRLSRLHAEVSEDALPLVIGRTADLQRLLGVPVDIEAGQPEELAHCTGDPDHCHGPMKTGIRVRRGSLPNGEALCTMGFHIRIGTDEQFTTAGHCGASGSNNWYHGGYGFVGAELATQYYALGRDAMRVQMPDSEASDDVYWDIGNLVGKKDPEVGEILCASLGKSDTRDCGWVVTAFQSYGSPDCGPCTIYGGDSDGILIVGGDSGSPMYAPGLPDQGIAVGLVSTVSGLFARVDDVLYIWGASLVT